MPRVQAVRLFGRAFPLLTVTVVVPDHEDIQMTALVDSGADKTIFPSEHLQAYGITYADLEVVGAGQGAGGSFERRRCTGEVSWRREVFCKTFEVAEPGKLAVALLGRDDFFTRFDVRFTWHLNPPEMEIEAAQALTSDSEEP